MLPTLPDNVINKIFMFMSSPTAQIINDAIHTQYLHIRKHTKYRRYLRLGYDFGELDEEFEWPALWKAGSLSKNQKLAFLMGYEKSTIDELDEAIENNADERHIEHCRAEYNALDEAIKHFIFAEN